MNRIKLLIMCAVALTTLAVEATAQYSYGQTVYAYSSRQGSYDAYGWGYSWNWETWTDPNGKVYTNTTYASSGSAASDQSGAISIPVVLNLVGTWYREYGGGHDHPQSATTWAAYPTPVVISAPSSPPTAIIGANRTLLLAGQTATITASFSAGQGDSLSGTNIDSPEGTGVPGHDGSLQATRTFTWVPSPSDAGTTKTFYARIVTPKYGWASYGSVQVSVSAQAFQPQPPTATMSASHATIAVGQTATINATFRAGDNDTLSNTNIDSPVGTSAPGQDGSPQLSRSYSFTPSASQAGQVVTFYARINTPNYTWNTYASTQVTVLSLPTADISATPVNGTAPLASTVTWTTSHASSVSVSGPGINSASASGSQSVTLPAGSHTFFITASSAGGSATKSVTVTVAAPALPPTASITVSPGSGKNPLTTTVSWNSSNASSVSVTGPGLNSGATSGSQAVTNGGGTHTYSILVTGPGGSASDSKQVVVAATPTATIAPDSGSISVGGSTTVRANFTTDSSRGDNLSATALNMVNPAGEETTVSGYGPGNLTHAFTPSSPGLYTFRAYAQTTLTPSWVVYASTTVDVPNRQPTITVASVTPANIYVGQAATINATITDADGNLRAMGILRYAGGSSYFRIPGVNYANTGWNGFPSDTSGYSGNNHSTDTASGSSNSKTVVFTPVSAGNYQFHVNGLDTSGSWTNNGPVFSLNAANRPSATVAPDNPSIVLGQGTSIRAAYSSDSTRGDPILETQINIHDPQGSAVAYPNGGAGNSIAYTLTPTQAGQYTFYAYMRTAINPSWTIYATGTLSVVHPQPTATLTATPASGVAPVTATVSWTTANATAVSVSGAGITSSSLSGNQVVNLAAGTHTINLTGTGPGGNVTRTATVSVAVANPVLSVATVTTADFGSIYRDSTAGTPTSANRSFTLSNTGNAPLTISSLSASGKFSVSAGLSLPFTLNPGASATVTLTFGPGASIGSNAGTFVAVASSNTVTTNLTGTGLAPIIGVSWR